MVCPIPTFFILGWGRVERPPAPPPPPVPPPICPSLGVWGMGHSFGDKLYFTRDMPEGNWVP